MSESAAIDQDEILKGIRGWVEIETPTVEPEAVNRLVSKVEHSYTDLGAAVQRIPGRDGFADHLRIRAPWGGDGPGLLILCHLDTVHPIGTLAETLPFRIDGDRAYGPGIYDMKGGGYLAYTAIRHLLSASRETPLPITLVYTSDEELGSPTSRPLIEAEARNARYVLIPEPARDGGKVVTSRKGTARFDLRITGRPAHSGSKHAEGRSAIKELAKQILDLEGMTDYETGLTVNVGVVAGGTRPNVVPETATAKVDVRIPTVDIREAVIARVRALKPYDPDVRIEVTGGEERPPYERHRHNVAFFERARELAAGIGVDLMDVATGGGSDGNFTAATVPTLDGLGVDGDGAHTLNEHLYVSSLVPRTRLMLRLMETLA